jgi:hypothetical protein
MKLQGNPDRLIEVLEQTATATPPKSTASEAERRALVQLIIPDEFSDVKDEIIEKPISIPFLASLAQTFQFYGYLQRENAALQKRIQSLRNLVTAAPSVLSPLRKPPPRVGSPTSCVKFGTCREADEFAKTSRVEKRLQTTIDKRQGAVRVLQSEVDQLKAELQGIKQQSSKAPLDEKVIAALEARQKESDELAAQIEEATKENLRLKQLITN